ncbi:MAG: fumarate hydratase C-terminal domain-containing protein [Candidatus Cloacimonetes bacterium]|nr:fumarate hydratase C-terminal domain-containing protein [Candidatus Cloacimonadota bacterium]
MRIIELTLPLTPADISGLQTGDKALLSGILYTARDQAQQRLCQLLDKNAELPFSLASATLFYCGPSPVPPGRICGAIGPTTASRMDKYTPQLIENGLRVMIGKGERSPQVQEFLRQYQAVYLTAIGGASAILAQSVTAFDLWCWQELGPEAIYRIAVKDFPCYVNCL